MGNVESDDAIFMVCMSEIGLKQYATMRIPSNCRSCNEGSYGRVYTIESSSDAYADWPPKCVVKVFKDGKPFDEGSSHEKTYTTIESKLHKTVDEFLRYMRERGSNSSPWWKADWWEYRTLVELTRVSDSSGEQCFPCPYAFGWVYCGKNGQIGLESGSITEHVICAAIVMENLSNFRSLYDVRQETEKNILSDSKVVAQLGLHLLGALDKMEKKSIVHRDISCHNVLVHLNDESIDQVRLIDFGTSCRASSATLTDRRDIGTYDFMAPECLELNDENEEIWYGEKEMEKIYSRNLPTVDIWSFGALIYYARTGDFPFRLRNYTHENGRNDVSHAELTRAKKQGILATQWACINKKKRSHKFNLLNDVIWECTQFYPRDRMRIDTIRQTLLDILAEESEKDIEKMNHSDNLKLEHTVLISV